MFLDLFVATVFLLLGVYTFGHFEVKTHIIRKMAKMAIYLGVVALVAWYLGSPWGLVTSLGFLALGVAFHFWWCLTHGINAWTAEPREKYYQLRGWS
jgi:hypothetical protein